MGLPGGGPNGPFCGFNPRANYLGDWCSNRLFEVLPFIPLGGITLALLTSPGMVPVGYRYPRPCVVLTFRCFLIASVYLRFGRTRWDFAGEMREPYVRRDCVCHPDRLHTAHRECGGRRAPGRGVANVLRPLRGRSSSVGD